MTASRWNDHVLEILDWIEEDDRALEELIFKPIMTRILQNEGELSDQEQVDVEDYEDQIPSSLPMN